MVKHTLIERKGTTTISENGLWQGTVIYMELRTEKEIILDSIVDGRTDLAEEYNESFIETEELDALW